MARGTVVATVSIVRIWKILAVLACLNACASHVPPDNVVFDSSPGAVPRGGSSHHECAAVDGGADAGTGCDDGTAGGGGDYYDDGTGTWVDDGSGGFADDGTWVDDGTGTSTDDGDPGDDSANDPDDANNAGDADNAGDDDNADDANNSTLESAHVNRKAAKAKKPTP